MRRTSAALSIVLLCTSALADDFDPDRAVAALRPLLKSSTILRADAADVDGVDGEWAAFLVESSGAYACVAWPATNERHAATWRGAIPVGTMAIAHTHPVTMPQPSRNDIAIAARLQLPFVVISRTHLYVAYPDGRTMVLSPKGWQQRDAGGAQTAAASPLR